MIYLDNAATTYPKSETFYSAIDDANRHHAFNVGRGGYKEASECFSVMEDTRRELAKYVAATDENVYFSSSATEALNQIIYGLGLSKGDTVYVSPFEHNAIARPLHVLEDNIGIDIRLIPFDRSSWKIDVRKMNNAFAIHPPKAVFVSQISNVTGYCVPYEDIFNASKKYNAVNVLDASQGFSIIPISNIKNIDLVVFAGHKSLYAGFGIAGFIKIGNPQLNIIKAGGTGTDSLNLNMPESGSARYEAGSPNIVAIYGLNAALKWLKTIDIEKKEREMTKFLLEKLSRNKKIILFHPSSISPFGIVSFAVKGYKASDVGLILSDEFDICVRTGYHCAPFVHDFIESTKYGGTIRVSLGYFNTMKLIIKGNI